MDKPLMMMTGDELLDLADKIIAKIPRHSADTASLDRQGGKALPDYVYGWVGLARLFGVSVNTAKSRYQTGALDRACKMHNGKLITRPDLAIRLWAEYKINKRKDKENVKE